MSSIEATAEPLAPVPAREPRVWKFWGTLLWGLLIFVAMFLGQAIVVVLLLAFQKGPIDMASAKQVLASGLTISLSVMAGLPAVLGAIWIATRLAGQPYADYLALRWTSWKSFAYGAVALFVLIEGWDLLSKALGRDVAPGFMMDVLNSARADGALWLLVLAFCLAAPITEEFFVRGFLYRGWSESFLRPVGAIILSSLVWTFMHLQYDWFFLGEVFSIGLLLGYMRYRLNSIWATIGLHALNNLAATVQTMWLASHPP